MGCTLKTPRANHEHDDKDNDNGVSDTALTHGTTRRLVLPAVALPFLPDHLILQILAWLPVKSLMRFRSVSKSWKSFISDPHFVKNHLHQSTLHPNFTLQRLLLLYNAYPWSLLVGENATSCSVQSLFHSPSTIAVDAGYPLKRGYRITGSCNGLLCLVHDKGYEHVLLWNPSLRLISKKSPFLGGFRWQKDPMYRFSLFGFGYDDVADNYKVVAVCCDPNVVEDSQKTEAKVYTLGANSWRQIQSFPYAPSMHQTMGIFVSGTLNWLATRNTQFGYPLKYEAYDKLVIVSLDLGEETYREVLLPDIEQECFGELGVLRDCLCFSHYYKGVGIIMWLMKEYGVIESWTKLETIPYPDTVVARLIYLKPLFITESDDALLQTGYGELVLYSPRGQILRKPEVRSDKSWSQSLIYVESLVSPG